MEQRLLVFVSLATNLERIHFRHAVFFVLSEASPRSDLATSVVVVFVAIPSILAIGGGKRAMNKRDGANVTHLDYSCSRLSRIEYAC